MSRGPQILLCTFLGTVLSLHQASAQVSTPNCFSCCGSALEAVNGTAAYVALSQLERDLLVSSCEEGCARVAATDCATSVTALEAVWCGFGFNFGRALTVELPDSQVYQCVAGVLANNVEAAENNNAQDQAFLAFVGGGVATLTLLFGGALMAYASKKRKERVEGLEMKEVHQDKPWVNSKSRAQWLVTRLVSLDGRHEEEEEQKQDEKKVDVEKDVVEDVDVDEDEEGRKTVQKEVRRRQAVDLRGLKPREMRMHRFFSRHRRDGPGGSSGEEDSEDEEYEISETIQPKV